MTKVVAAGNSNTASFTVLIDQGFQVEAISVSSDGSPYYCAKKDGNEFLGASPIEILGLITMFQARGADWYPTDEEVHYFTDFEDAAFESDET